MFIFQQRTILVQDRFTHLIFQFGSYRSLPFSRENLSFTCGLLLPKLICLLSSASVGCVSVANQAKQQQHKHQAKKSTATIITPANRSKQQTLDGRNHAIVIAESLARVIAAIRIASVRWRSYLSPKHRNWS